MVAEAAMAIHLPARRRYVELIPTVQIVLPASS